MIESVVFYIDGMNCAACSSGIERSLKRKSGVKDISVNLVAKSASIEFENDQIDLDEIFALIKKLGYIPRLQTRAEENRESHKSIFSRFWNFLNELDSRMPTKVRVGSALFLSVLILYLAMLPMFYPTLLPTILLNTKVNSILQLIITLMVMHLGRRFYIKGLPNLIYGNFNMDTLIALGSGASFLYSLYGMAGIFGFFSLKEEPHLYFESVCLIITFVLLGKSLEDYAKDDSMNALNALERFYHKNTLRLDKKSNEYVSTLFKDLNKGDVIKVLNGEMIPVDGVVLEGFSNVDESMLTGESLPITKQIHSNVYAGSINLDQALIVKVDKPCALSTIAQIFNLAKLAQNSKISIARIVDVVSGYFVPTVVCIAIIASIFWWIVKDFTFGMNVFVSILVVSCPCALGLAVPMAILIGTVKGIRNGILFRNAQALENAHKVDVVIFDKTGTLTTGNLEVKEIIGLRMDSQRVLEIAKNLEDGSNHLIAKAIKNYNLEADKLQVDEFETFLGYGVAGKINGEKYKLGRLDFVKNLEKQTLDSEDLESLNILNSYQDKMIVALAKEEGEKEILLGAILLEDQIKTDSRLSIDFLKNLGIRIMMLSGDRDSVVASVAKHLGIEEYHSNLNPEDKLEMIKKLKKEGRRIMMVGDGMNDAPALAQADIALAMGMGNDLSKEKADIILFNNHVLSVVDAILLSKRVVGNIQANLFWAFFYNIIAISVAAGLWVRVGLEFNPMLAALAMSLSSVCVVFSAQSLHLFKFLRNKHENGI